ncbi:autotransporter outer membrane beta-barrel domain-containing protein [Enterobacter mori]|uniref:autotransporter outer membrane beta-barrel domain-containing protein n=1 Tax=Enterobacter mori TaxID=539813 RepID=UPI001B8AFA15|nr:autotransporter outer membrane beta-barrel domain-containing protein [Enterobacter mori]MBS3046432.1 autotransporter domain-containing protein [Enterobacter mori]
MFRAYDAYSKYAQNSNEKSAGVAPDNIVSQAQPGIQTLYRAPDFSASDGSGIASVLQQLSPASWGAILASSLHREQQITDIVSEFHSPGTRTAGEDAWRSFAIPFGGSVRQQQQNDRAGYRSDSYGMVVGAEKQHGDNNWTFGFHSAISGQSVTVKSPYSGTGKTKTFNVGLHARYGFPQQEGGYLSASLRAGLEDGQLTRHIRVEDYTASNRSNWTGITTSAYAGGGYNYSLSEKNTLGPVAGLNYTRLHRPHVTENGKGGSSLDIDSATFNSLRSSIGLKNNGSHSLPSGAILSTELQFTWDHELLETSQLQTANFVGYSRAAFIHRNQIAGRNALNAKAGLRYQINQNVELGAGVSSELLRSGYDSLSGNLSVNWRF